MVWFSFWKSQTFGKKLKTFGLRIFFLEILKIRRLVRIFQWIFDCFECVSSVFCLKLLLIVNFTNTFLSKTKVFHRLRPYGFKIYSLKNNPRLCLDSRQSLETFAKIISVTSVSVIYSIFAIYACQIFELNMVCFFKFFKF
jgi:hypothetical protein